MERDGVRCTVVSKIKTLVIPRVDGDEKPSVTIQKLMPQNLDGHQRFFVCSGWWRKTKGTNTCKNTMNLCQFMHQFSETISQNLNIYKGRLEGDEKPVETIWALVWMVSVGFSTPSSLLCKYSHFVEWSRENYLRPFKYRNWYWNWCGFEAFQDLFHHHPNPETDTDADADHKRL